MKALRLTIKILLPLLVLAAFGWLAMQIFANPPEPRRRAGDADTPALAVDAVKLTPRDYRVLIDSQGTVSAQIDGTLVAQLGGTLVETSERLREGGFFRAGELLAVIDPRDYEIAVTIARAELARADAALQEEQARAELARQEQKLARRASTNPLALRQPQLAAAAAAVAAAKAQLARAELDLERTRIVAPYDGRVLKQLVDIGQYIAPRTALAEIYATDVAEVRLPLTGRQLNFLPLPDRDDVAADALPTVTLSARVGRETHRWRGHIVRAEGAIDTQSRQLFVIAHVRDPYAPGPDGRPPLRVGQFVTAEIRGALLDDVLVMPRAALAEGSEALLIDADGRLQRRRVDVLWSDGDDVVVGDDVAAGTLLSLTPLPGVLSGTLLDATVTDPERPRQRLAQRKDAPAAETEEPRP